MTIRKLEIDSLSKLLSFLWKVLIYLFNDIEQKSKRKAWNIEQKHISVKDSLEEIFKNHASEIDWNDKIEVDFLDEMPHQVSFLDTNNTDNVMVPLNLAIFQWIHKPIINQAKIINRSFLHLLFK